LDKTGTITKGEPRVTDVLPADGLTESALLALAAALEQRSEHPLARAVMLRAEEDKLSVSEVSDFRALPGNGLTATLNDEELLGGSLSFISTKADVPQALRDKAEALAEEGKTPLLFARAASWRA
ncbi:MAG: HAD family hydrolase, partial [Christensenellales bacterium]